MLRDRPRPALSLLLIIATLPALGEGVKCYVCNSAYHDFCAAVTEESGGYLKQCPPNLSALASGAPQPNTCRKIIMKGPFEERVVRYCAVKGTGDYQSKGSKGVKKLVFTCEGDACNPASNNHASPSLLFLPFSYLLFVFFSAH